MDFLRDKKQNDRHWGIKNQFFHIFKKQLTRQSCILPKIILFGQKMLKNTRGSYCPPWGLMEVFRR